MPIIDLRTYIVAASGTWQDAVLLANQRPFTFTLADTKSAEKLLLRWAGDSVTLAGPLRIRVTYQTENLTYEMGRTPATYRKQSDLELLEEGIGEVSTTVSDSNEPNQPGSAINPNAVLLGAASLQASTVYSYSLDIPAGQVWPFVYDPRTSKIELGANFYDRVLVEVAGFDHSKEPVSAADLPCDLAVADYPDAASFSPLACEPCEPGAQVKVPPGLTPALSVQAASGGCVRTRFFNGMFVTKEDLETEQRFFRIKNRLHNRTIGQGVVWGLDVTKHAEYICVHPGYAIDCCGNDLAVTTHYKVDIAALLRDPAAAEACTKSYGRAHRMHLLLEYVECPSAPRPVHNDPCGPTEQVCEHSRIRETVRLRLVPPCDPDTSGALRNFLKTAQNLHGKYRQRIETVTDLPASSTAVLLISADDVDVLEVPGDGSKSFFKTSQVMLSARAKGGVFTGGMLQVTEQEGNVLIAESPLALLSLPNAKEMEVTLNREKRYTIELTNWRVESPLSLNWADTGTTAYALSWGRTRWSVAAIEREAPVRVVPIRSRVCREPCETSRTPGREPDPCEPGEAAGTSIRWPWLHPDPLKKTHAGDPKAVVLGLIGAWLKQSTASSAEKGVPEPWSLKRLAASLIYRAAWLMFYGVDAADDRQDVKKALEDLLRDWCCGILYPGPVCGCEPHGVVIGCTIVKAGTIGDIDPFGGRRNVVQYPLITHWGKQLGLAPLDATLNRLFSRLCCMAALPQAATSSDAPGFVVQLGSEEQRTAYLAFGSEAGIAAAFEDETQEKLRVAVAHEVSFLLFSGYVIGALRGDLPSSSRDSSDGEVRDSSVERYTLGGLFEPGVVSLLVTRDRRTD